MDLRLLGLTEDEPRMLKRSQTNRPRHPRVRRSQRSPVGSHACSGTSLGSQLWELLLAELRLSVERTPEQLLEEQVIKLAG
jgi:hypothetical protein